MNPGPVAPPAAIRGAFDPTRANFFCGSCRSFVQAPPGAAGMRETDRVRRLREGATAESRRYCAAPSSAALSTPPKKHVEREASRARLTQALTQVASYRFVRPLVVWLGNRGAGAGRAGDAGGARRQQC